MNIVKIFIGLLVITGLYLDGVKRGFYWHSRIYQKERQLMEDAISRAEK
jgi:hypothetical protein